MDTRSLDRKGIFAYMLITFGITYAIELALIVPGFRADGGITASGVECALFDLQWDTA